MTIDQSVTDQHHKSVLDKGRFLDSSHLREDLKPIPQAFENLYHWLLHKVPSSPELTIAVQKLVETKDQAVRAQIHATENNLSLNATGSSSDQSAGTEPVPHTDVSVISTPSSAISPDSSAAPGATNPVADASTPVTGTDDSATQSLG
jgi:hypothetical protein